MTAHVRFGVTKGNTVPYPPLFDDIRRNHGFVDTRGHPELVDRIPEAQESAALAALLVYLARPGANLISLGCDLGQQIAARSRLSTRCVAGGYVQVAGSVRSTSEAEFAFLQSAAKRLEHALVSAAGTDRWEAELCLAPVVLKFGDETECQSIWIWFHAKASTRTGALESRERLLQTLATAFAAIDPIR